MVGEIVLTQQRNHYKTSHHNHSVSWQYIWQLQFFALLLYQRYIFSFATPKKNWNHHMVSRRQEQHPIMKSAVPFLKMLTLYMLWRTNFLSDCQCVQLYSTCAHTTLEQHSPE